MKRTGPTNVQLKGLIQLLKKQSSLQNAKIWKRVADDLEKPSRQRRAVNLFKIDKHSKENETVIVPGKVLGTGNLTHKVNIIAYDFSEGARQKISEAKGTAILIPEIMQKNPKGQGMRIIG